MLMDTLLQKREDAEGFLQRLMRRSRRRRDIAGRCFLPARNLRESGLADDFRHHSGDRSYRYPFAASQRDSIVVFDSRAGTSIRESGFVKILMKILVAICTLGVGWLLGIYLLDWSVFWKTALFFLACWGIGHIVYSILRAIDKRYG
ncbi:hypothetical protein SDC9_142841 [bioreactor metagenome]|uniref:Uncharacterized protein n=1 Tax=bioreactor metagenome TaxID=1076179 RepID=A0A645E2A2_9ZZZZ